MMRWMWLGLAVVVLLGCQGTAVKPAKGRAALLAEAKAGGYELISTADLFERVSSRSNMILIDATPTAHFEREHLLGATTYLFPEGEGMETWDASRFGGKLPEDFARALGADKSLPVVVYAEDTHSLRSHFGAAWAKKLGYAKVYRYAEGVAGWKRAGHETRSITRP